MRFPGAPLLLACLVAAPGSPRIAAAQDIDDDPARRWEFFLQQRRYPGTTGLGARLQAARLELLTRARLSAPPGEAGVVGVMWAPLGPERIPWFATSTGRVSDVKVHPADPDVLYVAGAQGGVWRSDDGGGSWRPLTDDQCSLAMGAVAIDPVRPDIVYAGTGEQHFSGDSYYGCGVLRSTDGGETWQRVGAAAFTGPFGGPRISRLLVDPLTAGSTTSTMLWTATTWGLYRSTTSGGAWIEVLDGVVTDLVLDPGDPTVLYAALYGDGVYRSPDGGLSWTRQSLGLPEGVGRINLAVAPSDGRVLFAAVADRTDGELLGIWRTTDGSATWEPRDAVGAGCGFQCWYDLTIAVHPAEPDVVYFGAVLLYRSDDGASSFNSILGPIHVDQHMITTDVRQPDRLWVGNDGGVYRSTDRGTTWTSLNTDLSLTQFYGGVSVDPTGASGLLGGTQDNGTVQYEGTARWALRLGGDGGHTAIHPLEDVRWMETQWGGVYSGPRRSDMGGPPEQRIEGIDLEEPAIFIPPLVMDPFDPDVLYFGTRTLYRTADRGASWQAVGTVFGEARISAIAPARSDGNVVYVGTDRGTAWVTRSGGLAWTDVSPGLPQRYVTDVAVHPADPATAWLTVSGFGSGHVFVTHDFGSTWTDRTGDLPDHPVNAVLLDPADPRRVHLGTDLGVFTSAGGGTWTLLGEGLPTVAVFDLATEPNAGLLVAGTHGRGAFYLPVEAPLELEVRAARVTGTATGGGAAVGGELPVAVYGTGWPAAGWSASPGPADWLTLPDASGVGRDVIAWSMDPGELWPGAYQETVTVTLDGGVGALGGSPPDGARTGSTEELAFELRVEATHTAALAAPVRTVEVAEGSEELVPDSVAVTLSGPGADASAWVARLDDGPPWLTLVDSMGSGSGTLRWTVDPTGLPVGERTAGMLVGGTTVAPVSFTAALVVAEPLAVSAASGRRIAAFAGIQEAIPDSAQVALTGFRAATTPWVARHGGSVWRTLGDSTGVGSGTVRWTVDPSAASEGTHVDTVTVVAGGPDGPPVEGGQAASARFVDTLVVQAPVGTPGAASELLDGGSLSADQQAILDRLGNRTGAYDLGDFLAWVDRCREAAVACPAAAPPGGGS